MTVLPKAPPELLRCGPGTVLAVRTGGQGAWWIRFGAALNKRDLPNLDNHIVGVHHLGDDGTVWGIEGRPGGVGWVDCAKYFTPPYDKYVITNWRQNIPAVTRKRICDKMIAAVGTKYDWPAIAADALDDLHLPDVWADHETWGDLSPAHVVCSSLFAWIYESEDLVGPYTMPAEGIKGGVLSRLPKIQPGDWTKWMLESGVS